MSAPGSHATATPTATSIGGAAVKAGAAAAPEAPAAPSSIGVATMRPDGTLTLRLRSDDSATGVAEGLFTYPPSHPQYPYIRKHVGPIEPGEQKPVAPFPDVK